MILRGALVFAGLLAMGWGGLRIADDRACDGAVRASFRVAAGAAGEARAAELAGTLEDRCRGGGQLASAASVFSGKGQRDVARRLAREATRRDPQDPLTWVAAGFVARDAGDAAGLAVARARLRELDPAARTLDGPRRR